MASVIDICNMALSHIGKYKILNLEEASKEAQECDLHYNQSRDSVLRDHVWGFATKRVTLAELSDSYEGWDYVYQWPTDCIRALRIYNSSSNDEIDKIPFEISVTSDLSSKVILTDEEDAVLIYTARVENPVVYDPLFITTLSYRLAAEIALPLRGDLNLQTQMLKLYASYLGRAQESDSNERFQIPDESCALLDARD